MATTFSKLRALKIKPDRTIECPLPSVDMGGGPVSLTMRYAGEANAPYWAALIAAPKIVAASGTQANINENREMAVALFSRHIIVGWSGVMEDDPTKPGEVRPAPCNPSNVRTFLTTLLDPETDGQDIFRDIQLAPGNPNDFRDGPIRDGVELGKA